MNWEAAGALGEIVGATGVILTLGYLAFQTRQNTKAINASTFLNNTSLWQDWFLAAAGVDTSDAFAQCMLGSQSVDPIRYQKFWMSCRALFLNYESQYFQLNQGVLDPESFKGYELALSGQTLVWPGIRAWWALNRHTYGAKYANYVDGLVSATETAAAHRANNLGEDFEAWKALLNGNQYDADT